MIGKPDVGYLAWSRYTAGRVRPGGEPYPRWESLTHRCREEWRALALQADLGGGTVAKMGGTHDRD